MGFASHWNSTALSFFGFLVFFAKLIFFFFLFAMVKALVPRYRYDQLMRLGWKVFLPTSIVAVVLIAAWRMFGPDTPRERSGGHGHGGADGAARRWSRGRTNSAKASPTTTRSTRRPKTCEAEGGTVKLRSVTTIASSQLLCVGGKAK